MKKILILALSLTAIYSCADKKEKTAMKIEETTTPDKKWWKEAIVYQIYPRSFQDTDGDGVGDLKGIINRLDYVKSLGVTAVWLNPIYGSPNDDNGYDVSDYRDIMSDFGTMEDFDIMLTEMHARNLKLIMDIVVNHSSDEHPWFKESRSSRDNKYRDYYHWWPAEKGKPPYRYSLFDEAGNAWKYDKQTNAYYLHYFSQKQPDLNWENPELRQEVYDIMRFWADKGVDGFRLDAFQFAAKDTTFPKFPDGFEKDFIQYYAMQDGLHDYLKEMNEEVFSNYDIMTVAEGAGRTLQEAHDLVDADRKEINMAYAFDAVDIPKVDGYKLADFKDMFSKWDSSFAKKGWISIFLSNHDQARMVNRYASDSIPFRAASAKMLNTFILSMRGTPYCYFGDELGMTNNPKLKEIEDYKDIAAVNGYKKAKSEGEDIDEYMRNLRFGSRDHGRTPMQWDASENSGFTTGNPWLPLNPNYTSVNVQHEAGDSDSVLNHFKSMTALRTTNEILIYGDYDLVQKEHPQIYAYTRTLGNKQMLVLLNFSETDSAIELENLSDFTRTAINNYSELNQIENKLTLKPFQAVILEHN
ncbi:MAG: alpha-glucosidase [Leeuwenhoekiella sp.]|nr:alpha-glucosidase [Leeuwenhoekiella sp.]